MAGIRRRVRRPQRIGEERVQNVGQQQFLVLLFMIGRPVRCASAASRIRIALQQAFNGFVHVRAVAKNFLQRRPRERGAQALFRECRKALVVAVEEPGEIGVEDAGMPGMYSRRMKDSKNQEVWARCHLTGEASGQDCTIMSSGVRGSHRAMVRRRVERKRSRRLALAGVDWAEGRRSFGLHFQFDVAIWMWFGPWMKEICDFASSFSSELLAGPSGSCSEASGDTACLPGVRFRPGWTVSHPFDAVQAHRLTNITSLEFHLVFDGRANEKTRASRACTG